MSNLFSGLEAMGLGNLTNIDVYEEKEKKETTNNTRTQVETFSEENAIFDQTYNCPVCDREFKAKKVKAGRAKLLDMDSDLRPRYKHIDPLKYDAIACPHCGYAAIVRFFKYVTDTQAGLIKNNISSTFKGLKESDGIIDYDEAIAKHKLALVNSIVKKAKTSERAYTCLKTAWVIRGKAENLSKDTPDYNKVIASLKKEEIEFITKAYEGFKEAFLKETFPMCGMDENTTTLLVADLARQTGNYDEAGRWVSKLLVSRDASERIKEKARDIKELLLDNK
ncbi:MAG: DUF2225 domain-containing protein [Clostridiales bacterium]|nr:DUF2225 domain-containing protein [Clostridiales bacterium]